jgi:hypothetical protein
MRRSRIFVGVEWVKPVLQTTVRSTIGDIKKALSEVQDLIPKPSVNPMPYLTPEVRNL